jgi:phosphoenolpyruvate-protein kinase (PTS system EI component)
MAPTAIPLAKQALRGLRARDAETLAARTLRARTAAEIEKLVTAFLSTHRNALK